MSPKYRGITIEHRPGEGRARPYSLRYRDANGIQKRLTYRTQRDADAAARAIHAKRTQFGVNVLNFDPEAYRRFERFVERVGNADLDEIAEHWLQTRGSKSMLVKDAVARYMKMRVENGMDGDTYRQTRLRLERRFVGAFGELKVAEVEAEKLREWLRAMTNPDTGGEMFPQTKRHHLSAVRAFYTWAIAEGIAQRNPCEAVHPPEIIREEVTVISVADLKKLMAANRRQPCIGRLALEAFAGLRYSSAALMQAEHIDWDRRGLILPASLHKSRKRLYVTGFPPVLWEWLKIAPKSCWKMTKRQYLDAKAEAFTRAKIARQRNVLRHSFCSYHLARHQDAAKTAYLLQHRNTTMLYQHYAGLATPGDAKAYFDLSP